MNVDVDVNKLLSKPHEYEDLITLYESFKKFSKKLEK